MEDRMLIKREGQYGGKIYFGTLSKQRILLKLIDTEDTDLMEWEEGMLSTLSHENIARIFYPLKLSEGNSVLLMEYVGKNIKEILRKFNEIDKKIIMYQLASAVSYLQENRIVYLGLCPQNIYVLKNFGNLVVKLINFQNSQIIDNDCEVLDSDCSFDGFSAPEVMQLYKDKNVYLSSDIYSLGCVFFYIITGGCQMTQIKYQSQVEGLPIRMKMIKENATFDILCKDLIYKMLEFEPQKRILHSKVKDHPCFWTVKETVEYFIDIGIFIERDPMYYDFLDKKSNRIFDFDWTEKLEKDVLKVIREIRQKTMKKSTVQDDINGNSVAYLVKIIRNSLAHATDERLVNIMGRSKDDLINYWNRKFPDLIVFLYNSKIEYY